MSNVPGIVYPYARGSTLKTRTLALILLIVAIASAGFTGYHLQQALSAQRELRSQMGDLSLATMTDSQASSTTVSLGERTFREALDSVRKTAHREEAVLAIELLGIAIGLLLLRRSSVAS